MQIVSAEMHSNIQSKAGRSAIVAVGFLECHVGRESVNGFRYRSSGPRCADGARCDGCAVSEIPKFGWMHGSSTVEMTATAGSD